MRTHTLRSAVRCLATVVGGGLLASSAPAGVTLYTSSTAFFNDLATNGFLPSTENFESPTTAGTIISDGGSVGGITFDNFSAGMPDLLVDDSFQTTSGSNYLGTDDSPNSNVIFGGDAFDLTFAASNAIGFNLVTAEIPNFSIFDNDVQINVPGSGTALLDVDALESTLSPGGDLVFFLGLIDDAATFTTAEIRYDPGAVGTMTFNIDDITTAVPEASEIALVVLGSFGLLVRRRLRPDFDE